MSHPWHRGERGLQAHYGVAGAMIRVGQRIIRDYIPDQHRSFFADLRFLIVAGVDSRGDVWPAMITGSTGFVQSPDPKRLCVRVTPDRRDPAWATLGSGEAIGVLGIDPRTRRRNRVNGRIVRKWEEGFEVEVEQSFGNCRQYIRRRVLEQASVSRQRGRAPLVTSAIEEWGSALIEAADTFFVASYFDPEESNRQVDVSHRGGSAGFVRIGDDGRLTIPDYSGNLHFNTLGNFLENPRAGLLFVDFRTGDTLQLVGDADVVLDSPAIASFEGAERIWTFRPRRAVLREGAIALRWSDLSG